MLQCKISSTGLFTDGDWLYFYADGEFFKTPADGSGEPIAAEYNPYVVPWDNLVYGIDDDYNLYREKLDGTEREMLIDNCNIYIFTINDGWIYYNADYRDDDYKKSGLYKRHVNNSDEIKLCDVLFVNSIKIIGDWVYYTEDTRSEFGRAGKVRCDGTDLSVTIYFGEPAIGVAGGGFSAKTIPFIPI